MTKSKYLLAIVLGIVAPIIGIFAGLQISGTLGNILAFPLIAVSFISGVPFGMGSLWLWLVALGLSIAIWIAIVYMFNYMFNLGK